MSSAYKDNLVSNLHLLTPCMEGVDFSIRDRGPIARLNNRRLDPLDKHFTKTKLLQKKQKTLDEGPYNTFIRHLILENKCHPLKKTVWSVDIICGKGVSNHVANNFESILISVCKRDIGL